MRHVREKGGRGTPGSTAEVAERIGLKQASTTNDWRVRYADFPKPVAELSAGMVWDWSDVEAWAKRIGRLK